jgi:hypothetical protein
MALPGRDVPLISKTRVSHAVQMHALFLLRCHSPSEHHMMPEPAMAREYGLSQVYGMYLAC